MDYGSFLFAGANKRSLGKLNSVQYKGLRIVLGAMRSSPTNALQMECQEMPFVLRSMRLGSRFILKKIANDSGLVLETLYDLTISANISGYWKNKPDSLPFLVHSLCESCFGTSQEGYPS